jgi:predicted DNA-binding protein (MmcQ/YjbR family)
MNLEELRTYCLAKSDVEECFPFGEVTLVYKVGGKIFLLAGMDEVPLSINIKADPEIAVEQRERYAAVTPGYHMNKKHWNTIVVDGSVGKNLIKQWIDDSYKLVASSLPKAKRKVVG